MRKKLLILFYLIMMLPLFCNEWINSTGVGLRIPGYYSVQACDDKNYDSLNFKSDLVGIDLIYLGYKESGFSFKNDLELLFGNFKENGSNLVSFLENDESINLVEKISLGYAIPLNEKIVLIPYLFCELSYLYAQDEHTTTTGLGSVREIYKYNSIGGCLGLDLTCIYNYSKMFFYLSMSFSSGLFYTDYSTVNIYSSNDIGGRKEIGNNWNTYSLSFDTAIGCSFKF